MYHAITSITDYYDKLNLAEQEFDSGKWKTAFGYFNACLLYAEAHGMDTSYLQMKCEDCSKHF